VLFLLLGSAPRATGGWEGQEVIREGVKHVLNPATPAEGQAEIVLEELWRLGGVTDEEGELFGVVSSVFRDDQGGFYLLDSQLNEVKVYSPDGEFIRSIGRPGEGPGEFQNTGDACLLSDGRIAVVQVFPGKAVLFNPDGTPAGDLALNLGEEGSGQSFLVALEVERVGERIGIGYMNQSFNQATLTQSSVLGLFDTQGQQTTRVLAFESEQDMRQGYPIIEAQSARFTRRWAAAPDGTIYTPVAFHGYEIHVFDPAGKLAMVIEREYEPLRRTPEEKQRIEEIYEGYARTAPNARVEIEDYHSDFDEILVRSDGTIWVFTSRGRWRVPEGVLGIYDVFDKQGHFIRQVTLLGSGDPRVDGVFLLGDRVVVVGNLMSAVVASVGGGDETAEGEEDLIGEEGVTITCFGM
jgi:hypothetical protein